MALSDTIHYHPVDMEYSVYPKGVVETEEHYDVTSNEPAKTAINASLSKKELFIHFLAIGATATVIVLNVIEQYWVDIGEDSWLTISAQIKQFAAKLHELVMMASLSYILMLYLHRLLIKGGIPFGLLDAPYVIGAGGGVGLLFNRRFWIRGAHNWRIVVVLLMWILLSLTLAPSSAIVMIPSLAYWPMKDPYSLQNSRVYFSIPELDGMNRSYSPWPTNKTGEWNVTNEVEDGDEDEDYCNKEDATNEVLKYDCPAGTWNPISQWLRSKLAIGSSSNLTINDAYTNSQRLILTRPLDTKQEWFGGRNETRRISTTPSFLGTASLAGFWAYLQNTQNGEVSKVKAPSLKSTEQSAPLQPIVYSQCYSSVYDLNFEGPSNITFQKIKAPWGEDHTSRVKIIERKEDLLKDLKPEDTRFSWFSADGLTTISVAILPINPLADLKDLKKSMIVACSFDARWVASTISLRPRTSSLIESNITDLSIFEEEKIKANFNSDMNSFKNTLKLSELVAIPQQWLDNFNFNKKIKDAPDTTNMVYFLESFTPPYNATATDFQEKEDFKMYQSRMEDMLGTMQSVLIADGMARYASFLWRPVLEINDRPRSKYIDLLNSNASAEAAEAKDVFQNATKEAAFFIEFEASRYGYGYGFRSDDTGISIKLGISVLGIYIIVALLYICTIIVLRCKGTYIRSQSWQTIQNLVALAKNSQHSTYLAGTGAGIQSRDTWGLNVKVRVDGDQKLNLAFMRGYEELGEAPAIERKYT